MRRFSAAQSLTVIFGGWGESLPSGGIRYRVFGSGTSLNYFRLFGSSLMEIGGETGTVIFGGGVSQPTQAESTKKGRLYMVF